MFGINEDKEYLARFHRFSIRSRFSGVISFWI